VTATLAVDEPALNVAELRDEVMRVSDAARAEFDRRGPTKRYARLAQERERYRVDLERLAPGDPVLEHEDRHDEAELERLRGHTARRYATTISGPASTPRDWARIAQTPAAGASRRRLLARVSGKLLGSRGGVDPALVLALAHALNAHRCSPPLPSEEVERVVVWAAGRHAEDAA